MKQRKLKYHIDTEDLSRAGEVSAKVRGILRKMGVPYNTVRRASICMYEGELNMFLHTAGSGGEIEVQIGQDSILICMMDTGPGISDIEQAMQKGWTSAGQEIRELGFGAGMGLPNMREYSDEMKIDAIVGKGTTVVMKIKVA